MNISVVYALPQEQYIEDLDVPEETTIEQALGMSHIHEHFPNLDLSVVKVGVFAKLAKLNQVLRDGDRIEIYRSLPRKPRDAHAADDKKARIRAKKERKQDTSK